MEQLVECKNCKEIKTRNEFYLTARGFLVQAKCKVCVSAEAKERYWKKGGREKYFKKYWEGRPPKKKKPSRGNRYRTDAEFRKQVLKEAKKRYATDAEFRGKVNQTTNRCFKAKPGWERALIRAKGRCTSDKHYKGRIKVCLTLREIKALWYRDVADFQFCPSLDRIDPEGDYTFRNCRFIEFSENRRRQT